MTERAIPPTPDDQPGSTCLGSAALTTLVALPFLVLELLVLRWLDPALLVHVQATPLLNRLGDYSALMAMVVLNVLLAYMARVELSSPRTRIEHAVNLLALPLFAVFPEALLLPFADPAIANARVGELFVIAICFASLCLACYIYGLWWAIGHPYHWPSVSTPADHAGTVRVASEKRGVGWIWLEPLVASRPLAPIWQVALLLPTTVLTVLQVAVIGSAPASQASYMWLGHSLLVSFVGAAIMVTLALLAMWRAAPMLPRYRRISRTPAITGPEWETIVEFRRRSTPA